MRFDAATCAPQPWKNGGGVTRELASRAGANGRMLWRLSLADIDRDGAFSPFPGVQRVHTIVAGQGLTLTGSDADFVARPMEPVQFSGDLDLMAQLADGPCRAFNVMFDPAQIAAQVEVCGEGDVAATNGQIAVYVIDGMATLGAAGNLSSKQGAVLDAPARVEVSAGASVLVVRLLRAPPADR